uniref:hypothetical protein n=1 Tax=Alistipes shahii TaxID=328814 RepID=UPI0026DD64D3|nr:hypothetical protein [Alistipes shahii]
MKVVNFWKTLFCAALAVTAFSACSDDDEEGGYSGMPEITVNGGESVTVAGKLEGGKLEQTVEVVSKGDWTLTFKNSGDSQWVTPSAMSGKTGTTQLTFTLGQASAERSAILVLTASSTFEGFPLTDEATIKIVQSDSSIPTGNALYSEDCGKEEIAKPYPYADKYEKWSRQGTLDQSGVVYGGSGAKVSWGTGSYLPAEDEVTEVSGPAFAYIGYADNVLDITNINVGTASNFTFTFTALLQTAYSNGPVFGEVSNSTIKFYVSANGEGGDDTFAPVTFTSKKVASGSWYICTAEFKLPAGTSTDKIAVRFTGFDRQTENQLRLDDFKLYEGGNGSEIVIPGPVDPELSTIGDIKTAGTYKVKDAIVVTRSEMAYVIADNTGSMLVYHSGNERSVGDKINISGAVTIYQAPNNPPQFDKEAAVEVVSTGNAWNYDFKEYSVDDVNAYFNNIVCTPIILKGKVVKEESNGKTFYNLELDGADATVLQGSVQYYTPDADKLDVPVAVKGYAVGKSQAGNITRIKIFPYEITVNSTEPYITATAPATFKAEGETINVAFNAGNLGSNKVFAKIEGTDAGQFTLGAVGANSVPVTAKANDGAAKSAKLTLYVAASEGAVAVKTTSVDLKQAAKPSGSGYAKIEKVADLKEGTGYLAGLVNGKYQTWTGALPSKQCETVPYSYTEATGAFVADDAAGAEISLVAVSGVSNAYYIKYGEKYLTVGAAGKNQLVLADSAGDNYWTFTDDTDGVKATAKAFASIMMTSTGAASKYIRSYVTTNTSGVAGVVFFLAK